MEGIGWGGGGGGGRGGAAYAASQITMLHMKGLNKNESPIFSFFRVFFVSKGNI